MPRLAAFQLGPMIGLLNVYGKISNVTHLAALQLGPMIGLLNVYGKISNVPRLAAFQLGPMIGLLKILKPRGFPTQLAHIPFPILLVCPLPLIDTKKRCTETMACPQVPKISNKNLK